jgi:hypothetical protein
MLAGLLRRSTEGGRRRRADARPERLARRRVTLTLAGPQRPALSAGLEVQLQDRRDEIARDPTIRSVVLTGEDPAFSAGGDLRMMLDGNRAVRDSNSAADTADPYIGSAASSGASSGRLHRPTSCSSQRSTAPRRASSLPSYSPATSSSPPSAPCSCAMAHGRHRGSPARPRTRRAPHDELLARADAWCDRAARLPLTPWR